MGDGTVCENSPETALNEADTLNRSVASEGREIIKGLEEKAELLRSEYYSHVAKYEHRMNFLKGITLFGSLTVSVLALTDQSYLGVIGLAFIALIGFALAVVAFVDPVFSQSEQLASYKRAVKDLTRFIRDSHAYNKNKKKGIKNLITGDQTEDQLILRYENIIENSPDSKLGVIDFLHHKRIHEMKVNISRMISKDPFDKEIEIKMKTLEMEIEKTEHS
jgi:hypothetical protein